MIMVTQDKPNKKSNIAMVAYTEYVRDPRVRRYAESLIRNGYQVDCFVLSESNKPNNQIINGVSLHHLNILQYRGNSNFSYILSYLKFFFLAQIALLKNLFKNYTVIHVHNMPDFLVFSTIINRLFGSKIILDIHDNMPELYLDKFKSFWGIFFYKLLLFQEKISCHYVHKVITVHIPHLEYNIKYHGLNRTKSIVIPNFADKNLFNNNFSSKGHTKNRNEFRMIYHGTIAERFGLVVVLKALKKVIKTFPLVRLDIYGKGDGVPDLEYWIKKLQLSKIVKYHGQIELDKIPQKILQADLGIVTYLHSEATKLMLPLKLMEYIAMGIPILTVKNIPISYYFNSNELVFYRANDPDSFFNKLINLIKSPGELTRLKSKTQLINKRLNWDNEESKYIKLISQLSGKY